MRFCSLFRKFSEYNNARYVVIPFPLEKTTSYIKGTSMGPNAIIKASKHLELYDEELDFIPAESGISTLKQIDCKVDIRTAIINAENILKSVVKDNKIPIMIGGEHTISISACKVFKNTTFIQFDAHADMRNEFGGKKLCHATVMTRIRDHMHAIQVGIRAMDYEEMEKIKKKKYQVFTSHDIKRDINGCINSLIKNAKKRIYISIDLDVLDPSIMPAVSTPEPSGLTWDQLLFLIKSIAKEKDVVGFDVVELCPIKYLEFPNFIAAKLIYKTISYIEYFR